MCRMEGKKKKALLEIVSSAVSGYAVVVLALACFIVGLMAVIALTRFIVGLGVVQTAPSSAQSNLSQPASVASVAPQREGFYATVTCAATAPYAAIAPHVAIAPYVATPHTSAASTAVARHT